MDEVSVELIHTVRPYSYYLLGYYRLDGNLWDMYSRNHAHHVNQFEHRKSGHQNHLKFGKEGHAVDVCPHSQSTKELVYFTGSTELKDLDIGKKSPRSGYEWSMHMTVNVDRETCWAESVKEAKSKCHLVLLDGVFMLHHSSPNHVALTIFNDEADKSDFFIPYNSWITIQLTFSHTRGYQLFLLDSDGLPVNKQQRGYKMSPQKPKSKLTIFKGFVGFASRFILRDERTKLPAALYSFRNRIVDIDFEN